MTMQLMYNAITDSTQILHEIDMTSVKQFLKSTSRRTEKRTYTGSEAIGLCGLAAPAEAQVLMLYIPRNGDMLEYTFIITRSD